MTNEQIEELKKLADDAETLDPWYNLDQIADGITYETDARFIAAANPTAVLGLLSELSTLRAAASAPRAELTDERAAFQTWALSEGFICDYTEGASGFHYLVEETTLVWEGWQAHAVLAQAAPVATPSTDLTPHLRQFQHNGGSDLVFGYDKAGVDREFAYLESKVQAAPVAAVPVGYVLVPLDPTMEMIAAGHGAAWDTGDLYQLRRDVHSVWAHMVTAAPAAPVAAAVPAGWVKNTGVQPVADDVLVEVKFRNGEFGGKKIKLGASCFRWSFTAFTSVDQDGNFDIVEWRLAAPAPDEASK